MRKSFILISVVMFLFSCNKNGNGKLEQKIEAEITKTCKGEGCTVDLSKLTPFKWNRFYVFKETASNETVEKAINQSYPYFTDIGRRLIFLDENNKIVYHEDIFPEVEGVSSNAVVFYMPDTINYRVYTSPIFTVQKVELENGYYYMLSQ